MGEISIRLYKNKDNYIILKQVDFQGIKGYMASQWKNEEKVVEQLIEEDQIENFKKMIAREGFIFNVSNSEKRSRKQKK
jgi:hypothetical protein